MGFTIFLIPVFRITETFLHVDFRFFKGVLQDVLCMLMETWFAFVPSASEVLLLTRRLPMTMTCARVSLHDMLTLCTPNIFFKIQLFREARAMLLMSYVP